LLRRIIGNLLDNAIRYANRGGETAFEVIAAARKNFDAELPAMLITGDTDPALIRVMAGPGIAVHYKPFQMDALEQFIQQALEP